MTITAKALYRGGQLTTAAASLYASPTSVTTIVDSTSFANTDGAGHALTVYIVRSGGKPTPANVLIPGRKIDGNSTDLADELSGVTLGPGDAIYAKADAGSVVTCAGINGFQVSSSGTV